MEFPLPALAPVIPAPPETVQLKVAFGSVLEIENGAVCPLQISCRVIFVATSKQTNLY
ncbi:MAG: hypothetical protein IPF58_10055 [Saprospirales bacterium]|nr:hypothetical protein [Saprospirales bacterium]